MTISGRLQGGFGGDQGRPAPMQCSAGARERGGVAMQMRTRALALLLPEPCRSVVHEPGVLMASRGPLVAADRTDHPVIIAQQRVAGHFATDDEEPGSGGGTLARRTTALRAAQGRRRRLGREGCSLRTR